MTNNQNPMTNECPNPNVQLKCPTVGIWVIVISLVIGAWSLIFFSSCGLRKPATAVTADIIDRGMIEVESEEDTFVAEQTALPLIKVLEVLHHGDINNKKFLGLLAKAYGNYAFGVGEIKMMKHNPPNPPLEKVGKQMSPPLLKGGEGGFSEWSSRTKTFYKKGMLSGIKTVSRGKKTIAEVPLPEFEKALKKYGKKDVPALFWTAFAWGSYINMSRDDIIEAANLPRVEAIIDRVIEINPGFQCGVAEAFKGAIIAGNPLRSGGKPEIAGPYFEKAVSYCDGKFLMTKVMYAEWFARAANDKKLFNDILNEVISADASLLPRYRLANELAKNRAKLLLSHRF